VGSADAWSEAQRKWLRTQPPMTPGDFGGLPEAPPKKPKRPRRETSGATTPRQTRARTGAGPRDRAEGESEGKEEKVYSDDDGVGSVERGIGRLGASPLPIVVAHPVSLRSLPAPRQQPQHPRAEGAPPSPNGPAPMDPRADGP